MKHNCHLINKSNDLYHLEEIEQVGTRWILHTILRANEKWVYDDEARQVGQVIYDHKITINFCPYCGEKLNPVAETHQTDLHKQHLPEPEYPELPPDRFFQCLEAERYNTGEKEKWFVIRDAEGSWMLEKYILASEEMVEMGRADDVWELVFLSGFDILFCPFCGELLSIASRHL